MVSPCRKKLPAISVFINITTSKKIMTEILSFWFFHYYLQPFSCPPSYSFRNEMTLANSLDTFIDTLNNLGVSSNIDFPEGGFEALLQVAACYKKLGKLITKLNLLIGPKARAICYQLNVKAE